MLNTDPVDMHEDAELEHLQALAEHPGWLAYQAWLDQNILRVTGELLDPEQDHAQTNFIRGGIKAYSLCKLGLNILIEERKDQLKASRK